MAQKVTGSSPVSHLGSSINVIGASIAQRRMSMSKERMETGVNIHGFGMGRGLVVGEFSVVCYGGKSGTGGGLVTVSKHGMVERFSFPIDGGIRGSGNDNFFTNGYDFIGSMIPESRELSIREIAETIRFFSLINKKYLLNNYLLDIQTIKKVIEVMSYLNYEGGERVIVDLLINMGMDTANPKEILGVLVEFCKGKSALTEYAFSRYNLLFRIKEK